MATQGDKIPDVALAKIGDAVVYQRIKVADVTA